MTASASNDAVVLVYPLIGLVAWILPCLHVGTIAEAVDQDKTLCIIGSLAALLFLPIAYIGIRIYLRNKLRELKGIEVCTTISTPPSHHTSDLK